MSALDLEKKYGRGNTKALINRAVRAELVGGDHCLDALNALDQLRHQWVTRGWSDGLGEINEALRNVHRLAALLRGEVRRRYGMPPEGAR